MELLAAAIEVHNLYYPGVRQQLYHEQCEKLTTKAYTAHFQIKHKKFRSNFYYPKSGVLRSLLPFLLFRFVRCILQHDNENANKNCHKVCEEGQGMFHIVQVPAVGSLNDLLGVEHHISQEYQ